MSLFLACVLLCKVRRLRSIDVHTLSQEILILLVCGWACEMIFFESSPHDTGGVENHWVKLVSESTSTSDIL